MDWVPASTHLEQKAQRDSRSQGGYYPCHLGAAVSPDTAPAGQVVQVCQKIHLGSPRGVPGTLESLRAVQAADLQVAGKVCAEEVAWERNRVRPAAHSSSSTSTDHMDPPASHPAEEVDHVTPRAVTCVVSLAQVGRAARWT